MTQGDAHWKAFEKLTTNLALIWAPQKRPATKRKWVSEEGQLLFEVDLTSTVRFTYCDTTHSNNRPKNTVLQNVFMLSCAESESRMVLCCQHDQSDLSAMRHTEKYSEALDLNVPDIDFWSGDNDEHSPELQEFIAQWLPLFRRNCFLSGAPIECTAHERLEWHLWFQERNEH